MTENEYLARLDEIEQALSAVYQKRRALMEAFADEHPPAAMPSKLRNRTEAQQRVARCPRCGGRLENPVGGE